MPLQSYRDLNIIGRRKYVPKEMIEPIWELTQRVGQMLTKLINSLKK